MTTMQHHAHWVAWYHARSYRLVEKHQNVELLVSDDVKVRTMSLPPRKYTPKELKDLKGNDPRLPGYTSDFSFLKPPQVMDLYMAPAEVVTTSDSADAAMKVDPRPRVVMIVVAE